MKPTLLAGGGLCSIQACAHSMAFLSPHIGSGPGLSGLSGIQVKPLVPLRSSRILPPASIATIVASLATDTGAACMALAIICSSVICAVGVCWAAAVDIKDITATQTVKHT